MKQFILALLVSVCFIYLTSVPEKVDTSGMVVLEPIGYLNLSLLNYKGE